MAAETEDGLSHWDLNPFRKPEHGYVTDRLIQVFVRKKTGTHEIKYIDNPEEKKSGPRQNTKRNK
jgi:hypothetical protein